MKYAFFHGRRSAGFTLIEMLVVVVIISILAAIAFAYLRPAVADARDAARMSDIDQLAVALRLYIERYDSFPSHAAGTRVGEGGSFDSAIAPFMTPPHDPIGTGNSTYFYVYDSSFTCPLIGTNKVVIYATLEDPEQGNWREVCNSSGPENRYIRVF